MRRPNAGTEPRPGSIRHASQAAKASGLARSKAEAVGGELKIAGGGSYLVCVRACDGGFFPVPYVGDRDLLAKICQGVVSERRDATLFHAVWRHDRAVRFDVRRAVRHPPQRRQIRAGGRSELLLPARGSELGGGAGGGRGEVSAPLWRYSGDAGNLRADVAAGGAAKDQPLRRPARPTRTPWRWSRNPSRSQWFSTPMAWTST